MTLFVEDQQAYIGETYKTFRGEEVTLLEIREPHKPSSSGKVYLQFKNGAVGEFYPSVIGGKWR